MPRGMGRPLAEPVLSDEKRWFPEAPGGALDGRRDRNVAHVDPAHPGRSRPAAALACPLHVDLGSNAGSPSDPQAGAARTA